MTIEFELNGETRRVRYDGQSYMPLVKITGINRKTGEQASGEKEDGYYSKLSSAVKRIIDKTMADSDETISIQEYVERYESAIAQLKNQLDFDDI